MHEWYTKSHPEWFTKSLPEWCTKSLPEWYTKSHPEWCTKSHPEWCTKSPPPPPPHTHMCMNDMHVSNGAKRNVHGCYTFMLWLNMQRCCCNSYSLVPRLHKDSTAGEKGERGYKSYIIGMIYHQSVI